MPKFLKYFLILTLSLLLVLVIAIAGLLIFIDPNDYKNEIASKVQDATGRQLTISGDINFSLVPWLGLSLGETTLSNAEGFGHRPFASVNQVDIKVKLFPLLLQQRIEMQQVRLHGLQANLAKDKTGRSNWDDLTTAKSTTEKKSKTQKEPDKPEPQKPEMGVLAALAVDGLELKDAQLDWTDQQANQHIVVSKLSLVTGPLALPEPVDVSLAMDVQVNQPEMKGHVDFKGQVALDLQAQQYHANKLDLKFSARGEGLPVKSIDARLQANVSADLSQQAIDVKKLQLDTLGTALTGQVRITGLDKTPGAHGHITVDNVSPRDIANRLGIQLPVTSDQSVLKKASMDLEFAANQNEASLKKLKIKLDDTELNGSASVKYFAAPAIRFTLNANGIDMDRYLPPRPDKPSKQTKPAAPTPGSTAAAATTLPLEPLRSLDVDGNITLGKLKIVGAQLSDMQLGINGKGGQLQLHPIKGNLYNGHYDGDIKLDVRTDTPKVSVNEKLTTVNVGPLLKDVMGKELVSGTANITANMTTAGSDLESIKKTLNGKANFSFTDGKVNGVNIGQMIREAYAKLKKKPAPPKTENATDFAEMSGSITATNGIVRNNDLDAKSPLLRIKGEGKVDLPRDHISYLVSAAIVESNEGQTGKELEELKSLVIPIKVTGGITDPKFSLDLGPVLQKRAKQIIDKKISKEEKKIKKRIEKDLKKKLEEELKKKLGF